MASLGGFLLIFLCFVGYPLASLQHDTSAQTYHALGFEALEQGRYDDAKVLFEKTLAVDSEYGWAYGNLMLTELALNHFDSAETSLKKLIVLRPDDLGNYRKLRILRELKEASAEMKRARVADFLSESQVPDYDADFNEGQRFLAAGDEGRAEEHFRRSLEQHGYPTATLVALAGLKKKQGDLGAARELLRRVVEREPEVFLARYNLANVYIEEKNFVQVASLLKDIYDFTPELGEAWYNYAVALINLKKTAEAVPVMRAYIDRYQDDPNRKNVVEKFRTALKPVENNSLDALLKEKR